jgi:hypothetical protein
MSINQPFLNRVDSARDCHEHGPMKQSAFPSLGLFNLWIIIVKMIQSWTRPTSHPIPSNDERSPSVPDRLPNQILMRSMAFSGTQFWIRIMEPAGRDFQGSQL